MRRAAWIVVSVGVGLACQTTSVPSITSSGADTTCTSFCGEQQSRGTLVGPLADCLNSCCANSVARCGEGDAGYEDVAPPNEDSGPDTAPSSPDVSVPDSTSMADVSVDSSGEDSSGGDSGGDADCIQCGVGCCSTGQMCLNGTCATPCATAADCPTSCCAPATDGSGNAIGPYVCKANDAAPYDCCYGITTICGNNYCCVADTQGNQFCATPCTSSSSCGTAQCNTYDFSHTSCDGTSACGPP